MSQWSSWQLNSDYQTLLLLSALTALWMSYIVCWVMLRRSGNRTASTGRLVYWFFGLLVISIATMSAIDSMADSLFSVHMVQHILLIDLAPPLLLLGRPFSIWQAVIVHRHPNPAIEASPWQNPLMKGLGFILRPAVAWGLSAIILLVWHLPWLYDYALVHPNVHEFGEHTTLFLTFLIWWQPLIGSLPQFPYLATSKGRFFYLLAGMVPSILLGLLILFWPDVLYTYYLNIPPIDGISGILDQRLGALVMLSSTMAVMFFVGLPLQYFERRPLS